MRPRTRPTERQAEETVAAELGVTRNQLLLLAQRERAKAKALTLVRLTRELLDRARACADVEGHPHALCAEASKLLDQIDGQLPLVLLGQGDYTKEIHG